MAKFIQIPTRASFYDGAFDGVVGWSAAGMGYIIVGENGKLTVIDGGDREDAQQIISLLQKYSGESVPTVDLWIITHSHLDHYGALLEIATNDALCRSLNIKKLLYYFPPEYRDHKDNFCNLAPIEKMKEIGARTGALHHVPHTDESFELDGLKFHFIYVPEDCEPINRHFNSNLCSLVFTVECNRKLMITGDAFKVNLGIIVKNNRGKLKCDILQLPHHALCDTGSEEFYREVDAKTVILPISIAGDRSMGTIYYEQNVANRAAAESAERVIRAYDGVVELDI